MSTIKLLPLTKSMKASVAELYARVYAGPPWFEIKKCRNCNETYGKLDDLDQFHDGDICRRCGKQLTLIDYWLGGPALEVFEDAASRSGFCGYGAQQSDGNLCGLSWGFPIPEIDTPTVWFSKVNSLVEARGIDPRSTFYAAETAVAPEMQHRGIGSVLSYSRIHVAHRLGQSGVCFRTINPKMVRAFESFFTVGSLRTLFKDPDPVKADRVWYYGAFKDRRDRPDLLGAIDPD